MKNERTGRSLWCPRQHITETATPRAQLARLRCIVSVPVTVANWIEMATALRASHIAVDGDLIVK